MGYKITKENYKFKTYLWDAELEALLALFIKRLWFLRPDINPMLVTKEIMNKYIKKNKNSKVSATKMMREIYGRI